MAPLSSTSVPLSIPMNDITHISVQISELKFFLNIYDLGKVMLAGTNIYKMSKAIIAGKAYIQSYTQYYTH